MNKYTVFFLIPAFQNTEPNMDLIRPKHGAGMAQLGVMILHKLYIQ
jgi:hypothetical protein